MRATGPYSRIDLPTFNGRTREGAFLRGVRAQLVNHVGGHPTPPQAALIEAAAQLRLRISLMDRKFAETGTQTEHDSRTYLSWVSTLSRLMSRLDTLKGAGAAPVQTLAELLAGIPRNTATTPAPMPATAVGSTDGADARDDDREALAPVYGDAA